MSYWECECGWQGKELADHKIKKVGYYETWRGCPDCGARIGQGVEPKVHNRS